MTNEMTTEIALHCMKSAICEEVCEECPMYGEVGTDHCEDDAHRLAIQAIEEIQQYRAIGTVEEIQSKLEAYRELGTMEEFKDLKEKNTPYKPQEYEDRYYACKCDNIVLPKWRKYPTELMPKSEGLPHCMACGQKLDWSE